MSAGRLSGVVPIVPTPFTPTGDVDPRSLGEVVSYLLGTGVHGIAVLGMASEGFSLTDSERDVVIRTAAEYAAGRVPIVAGCSHNSAHAARELAIAARRAGADILMVMPPTMGNPAPAEVVAYFTAVETAAEIPIMVQDNPAWSGLTLSTETFTRLAQREGIQYVKVETKHPPTTMRGIRHLVDGSLTLFGGLGGNWLPEELASGVAGTMPGSIMPQVYVRLWELWTTGCYKEARAVFNRYHPAIRVTGQPALGIAMTKHLLWSIGVIAGPDVRSPLRRLGADDRDDLEAVCSELELLAVMRGELPPADDL